MGRNPLDPSSSLPSPLLRHSQYNVRGPPNGTCAMTKKAHPEAAQLHALEYLYRDAANWKTHGLVLLQGPCPPTLQAQIIDALDSGLYFVAEQVKLPALQRRHNAEYGNADEDLDHAFHEFFELRPATASDLAQAELTVSAEDVGRLFAMAKRRWDCGLSPYC